MVDDAAGQALRGLAQQRRRRGAEQQETPGAPPAVDEHAQDRKELGPALHLVDDDQLVAVVREKQLGVGEPSEVRGPFQVEIDHAGTCLRNRLRKGGFAGLTRTDERYDRKALQRALYARPQPPCSHACNLNDYLSICKVDTGNEHVPDRAVAPCPEPGMDGRRTEDCFRPESQPSSPARGVSVGVRRARRLVNWYTSSGFTAAQPRARIPVPGWGRSSAGRAPESHSGGRAFDPRRLHQ